MLELIGLGYEILKDIGGAAEAALRRKRRNLSPSEIVAYRQKWKPEFETKIWETHKTDLRSDVIVRDMRRIDRYPDLDDARGISPWFRAGLMGTYHRGIYLGLGWETLMRHTDGTRWRSTRSSAGESGDIKVILMGSVRYEDIESVDWNGDEFYGFPHIYCFFAHKKEPYERVAYYTKTEPPNGIPFYTEIADYHSVRRLDRRLGIKK